MVHGMHLLLKVGVQTWGRCVSRDGPLIGHGFNSHQLWPFMMVMFGCFGGVGWVHRRWPTLTPIYIMFNVMVQLEGSTG